MGRRNRHPRRDSDTNENNQAANDNDDQTHQEEEQQQQTTVTSAAPTTTDAAAVPPPARAAATTAEEEPSSIAASSDEREEVEQQHSQEAKKQMPADEEAATEREHSSATPHHDQSSATVVIGDSPARSSSEDQQEDHNNAADEQTQQRQRANDELRATADLPTAPPATEGTKRIPTSDKKKTRAEPFAAPWKAACATAANRASAAACNGAQWIAAKAPAQAVSFVGGLVQKSKKKDQKKESPVTSDEEKKKVSLSLTAIPLEAFILFRALAITAVVFLLYVALQIRAAVKGSPHFAKPYLRTEECVAAQWQRFAAIRMGVFGAVVRSYGAVDAIVRGKVVAPLRKRNFAATAAVVELSLETPQQIGHELSYAFAAAQ